MKILFLTNDYFDMVHSRKPFVEYLNSQNSVECTLRLVSNSYPSRHIGFKKSLKGIINIACFIREGGYNIVISRGVELSILLLPIFLFSKFKKIIYLTGLGSLWGNRASFKTLPFRWIYYLYIKFLKILGCTFWVQNQDDFLELGLTDNDKIINGSGVKCSKVSFLKEKNNRILFAGRISYQKGFYRLIELAEHLPDNWKLYVCGELDSSILKKDIEIFRSKVDSGKLLFEGFVEDLSPYFKKCAFAFYPTYYREGTPRFVLESMSNGLFPLVPYVPGCKKILEDGKGIDVNKKGWLQELLIMDDSYFKLSVNHNFNLINRAYSHQIIFREKLKLLWSY